MKSPAIRTPHTLRNLVIFVTCVVALPWLGWGLDMARQADPHNQQDSLGWLFFILSPLAASLLLRAFGGDGWRDLGIRPAFRGNAKWYLFSLLFHPAITTAILLAGFAFGAVLIPDQSLAKLALVGQATLLAIIPGIVKNIFEEFGWRGYLEPKIQLVVKNVLAGHILVGIVWFTWHLPYYLVLLSPAAIQSFTSLSMAVFLALALASLVAASIVYGQVRLRTHSVWPAVLMYAGGNVLIGALVEQNFFSLSSAGAEAVLSPGWTGLVSIALFAAIGLWFHRRRTASLGQRVRPKRCTARVTHASHQPAAPIPRLKGCAGRPPQGARALVQVQARSRARPAHARAA